MSTRYSGAGTEALVNVNPLESVKTGGLMMRDDETSLLRGVIGNCTLITNAVAPLDDEEEGFGGFSRKRHSG
ncbi:hypothetical protein FRC03_011314 [Tulasnella sp. 419]|nr:hypothetical protein FRC03_011314 [Tulasnella sp. 419]